MNLKIDIYRLEQECAENPQQLFDSGNAYVDANYEYSKIKLRKEQLEASLSMQIRKDPKSFGLDKVTENAIAEAVTNHSDMIKAKNDEVEAYYGMEKAKVLRDAISQKSSLLKQEVSLWVTNYYSDANDSVIEKAIMKRRKDEQATM